MNIQYSPIDRYVMLLCNDEKHFCLKYCHGCPLQSPVCLSSIEFAGTIFIEVVDDTVEIRAKTAFSNLCKVVVHLFIAVRIRRCVKDFTNHMLPCQD